MEQKDSKKTFFNSFILIEYITIFVFAIRAISDGMLAFASSNYMPLFSIFIKVSVYLTIPMGVIYVIRHAKIDYERAFIGLLPIVFLIILFINTYGGYSGEWLTSFIAIFSFAMMLPTDKCKVYSALYKTIIILNIISIILYIFAVLNINIGFQVVGYYTGVENATYYKWFIFAILRQGVSQYRLCGIFNEPGGLGTICAFLYIINYNSSKKWEKIVLLLSIALTFSMAGYLLIFLFVSMHLLKKDWKYVFLVGIFLLLFLKISSIDFGNETINYLAKRFEITETGFRGDARYDLGFSTFYDSFIKSTKAILGYGYGYPEAMGISTYKQWIVQIGVLGFIIYIVMIIITSLKVSKKNKDCIVLLILFIISIYQRPLSISSLNGYVILFGGMNYIQQNMMQDSYLIKEG